MIYDVYKLCDSSPLMTSCIETIYLLISVSMRVDMWVYDLHVYKWFHTFTLPVPASHYTVCNLPSYYGIYILHVVYTYTSIY